MRMAMKSELGEFYNILYHNNTHNTQEKMCITMLTHIPNNPKKEDVGRE